jgi:uncharacterized protein YpmS
VIIKKLMQYYVAGFYILLALGIIFFILISCRTLLENNRQEFINNCTQNNGYIIEDYRGRLSCAYSN